MEMQLGQLLLTPVPTTTRVGGKGPKEERAAYIPWEWDSPRDAQPGRAPGRQEEDGGAFALAMSRDSSRRDVRCSVSLPGASRPSLEQGPAAFK